MSRWKAASIHLTISIFIGLVAAVLLFTLWYPPPYFHAGGADELVLLLVGVDLTLGPLLTLIVFRSGKRGLKFDLVVIGVLQTAALVYGLSIVSKSRPVFLVAVPDRFELVAASDILDDDLAKGSEPRFRSRAWTGPRLVAAPLPDDPHEKNELTSAAMSGGGDLQTLPKYYRDFPAIKDRLLGNAKPLKDLQAKHPEAEAEIASQLSRLGRAESSVRWVPLVAKKNDMVMLLDATSAEPLGTLAVDPW